MREDEFEKRVRDKMEQLGFAPSESVWVNVDQEINKEKKRRAPLFWLFFVSGLLLAGGAYYFVADKNIPVRPEKLSAPQEITKKKNNDPATQSTERQKNIQETPGERTANNLKVVVHSSMHPSFSGPMSQKLNGHSGKQKFAKKETRTIDGLNNGKNVLKENPVAGASGIVAANNNNNQSEKPETEIANKKNPDSASGKIETAAVENKLKKDSVANSTIANHKDQKTKHSAWKFGYSLNAGFSNLNQDLFNSVKTLPPTTNLTSTPYVNPPNRGTVTYSSSPIHAGFSFAAGAYVSRDLSKRFSFSVGINYHYYSTKISTGGKIDNGLYAVNNGVITTSSYYENGSTEKFTNQYHFLETPLLVSVKLNKSNKKILSFELGLSPEYLLGSKALYYNPNANIYTTDYLQPNKMQLNGMTALMIGFPVHQGEIQLGPQLQYGLTGFVNTNDGNPGHLFYAGLKISFIPGKK